MVELLGHTALLADFSGIKRPYLPEYKNRCRGVAIIVYESQVEGVKMDLMREKAYIVAIMAGVSVGLYGVAELLVNKLF
jgi:hypothetical protein